MLTVLLLSCNRPNLLRRTVEAVRRHFNGIETAIRPVWVCFDNGSTMEVRRALEGMGFDTLILSGTNRGVAPAMNQLLAAVRTPYLLNLQDDWLLENPRRAAFVRESVRILEWDPKLAQVKLDACHFLNFNDRKTYDGPFQVAPGGVPYYVQNPRMLWGGFTFPPAISRLDAIHELGPIREDQPFRRGWAESEYSARFAFRYHAVKSPEMLLFRHIGIEASPGWQDEERVHPSPSRSAAPGAGEDSFAQKRLCRPPASAESRPTVACLLTVYRRPQLLREQLEAVKNQTVRPDEVAVWVNHHPDHPVDEELLRSVRHVRSDTHNWGVWPRFLFCSEFASEFVCVFDDDTIPGQRWLENCLQTMRTHEGLLGTNGVVFLDGARGRQAKVGWINPRNEPTEVDIVGHAWFFKRDWLRFFALEPRRGHPTCGEDYHFSVALQKHLGLPTFVPPHDPSDRTGWGSVRGDLGQDKVALYLQPEEDGKKQETHNAYLAAGWKPLAQRERISVAAPAVVVSGDPPHASAAAAGQRSNGKISAMRFEQDFRRDFEKIDLRGAPFAFARFGDGEIALCAGRPIAVSDGWRYDGGDTPLAGKLREAVQVDLPGFYLGISCRCCNPEGHRWYRERIRAPLWRTTFANLFVNGNYDRFLRLDLSDTVLVSGNGGDFTVPRNAVNPEFDYRELLQKLFKVDRPILVAAGPVGKALIYDYWREAPHRQTIVDVGSALDPSLHGGPTRGYHHPEHPNRSRNCVW